MRQHSTKQGGAPDSDKRFAPTIKVCPCGNYDVPLINLNPLWIIPCSMRPADRERMYQLCALIEKEQDHHRFLQLIEELNELLERQERRFDKPPTTV